MERNNLSNAIDSVNEKDANAFKTLLSQELSNRLFASLESRKQAVAQEILGEHEVSEANILAPTAPPVVGVKKKNGNTLLPPPSSKTIKTKGANEDVEALKAKADLAKAKSFISANKAKEDAVDIKRNVLGKKELETMQKQIDAVTDNSVDIAFLKPVPGGFEVHKDQDQGLNPEVEKEFLVKTFQHNGKIVELKQIGLGLSRPIRVYIDGDRWNFFPGLESATEMTMQYIDMTANKGQAATKMNSDTVSPNSLKPKPIAKKESIEQELPLTEKVDLDGRTRLVRSTMARLEQYRKTRIERAQKMQEEQQGGKNKYKGLYDDGSGKGAFVPQPYDTGKPVHPFMPKSVTEGVLDEFKDMMKKENMTFKEGDKAEYERFFKAAMKRFGISAPSDLKTDEEKKRFFAHIKKNYKG
jgi:hypothetical protein